MRDFCVATTAAIPLLLISLFTEIRHFGKLAQHRPGKLRLPRSLQLSLWGAFLVELMILAYTPWAPEAKPTGPSHSLIVGVGVLTVAWLFFGVVFTAMENIGLLSEAPADTSGDV
jgi:hypothetical protein